MSGPTTYPCDNGRRMFRRLELLVDDEVQEIRKCACGCGAEFLVYRLSKRIYYSRKHKEIAKNLRRKFRDADVQFPETAPVSHRRR